MLAQNANHPKKKNILDGLGEARGKKDAGTPVALQLTACNADATMKYINRSYALFQEQLDFFYICLCIFFHSLANGF